MNLNIKVSVIIPTFNRYKLLIRTLDSILEQSFDLLKLEVIISDDGSNDDTDIVVSQYVNKLNIIYIYQDRLGRRLSLARNKAIAQASGEFCLFIDCGVLLSKDCINNHLTNTESYRLKSKVASIGCVYGLTEFQINDDILIKIIETLTIDECIYYFNLRKIFPDSRDIYLTKYNYDISSFLAPWVFFWTGNIMVSTTILIENEMFDTNYDRFWGMEDIDLGYRLFKKGVKLLYNRNAATIHYPHENNTSEKQSQNNINKDYFYQKHNNDPIVKLFLKKGWSINDYPVEINKP